MEAATCSQRLSLWSPIDSERFIRKPNGFLTMSYGSMEDQRLRMLVSRNLGRSTVQIREKLVPFVPSCCVKNTQAPALETEHTYDSIGVPLTLKKKSQDVAPYLSGRCIYLVGMMGSGKTTVGKILSEVLGYSFIDSDKLVEEAVNGISVAQIFEKFSESFFRDNESEALRKLSVMHHLVVATGGGAVIRPINWRYMKQGITVWLDVPIEALARRIAAVGTDSRPLLHNEVGDAYTKALQRLSSLYEERGEAYANADATVSLECAAAKLDLVDVCDLSPTDIALEVLVQIENFLLSGKDKAAVARK